MAEVEWSGAERRGHATRVEAPVRRRADLLWRQPSQVSVIEARIKAERIVQSKMNEYNTIGFCAWPKSPVDLFTRGWLLTLAREICHSLLVCRADRTEPFRGGGGSVLAARAGQDGSTFGGQEVACGD